MPTWNKTIPGNASKFNMIGSKAINDLTLKPRARKFKFSATGN